MALHVGDIQETETKVIFRKFEEGWIGIGMQRFLQDPAQHTALSSPLGFNGQHTVSNCGKLLKRWEYQNT